MHREIANFHENHSQSQQNEAENGDTEELFHRIPVVFTQLFEAINEDVCFITHVHFHHEVLYLNFCIKFCT